MTGANDLVGASEASRRLRAQIDSIAAFDEPVLVLGETGVGKELVARRLHARSRRAGRALQVIHCAGIGNDLLGAELFGHRRGAFTGAASDRDGRIRAADGATVVLDEVTETTPQFQAALLRTIEQGEVQPLGMDSSARVDVRFIATSNRPLAQLAAGQGFRLDLFHRLAAFVIEVPPLRQRLQDIDDLADHFLAQLSARYGTPRSLSPAARALLREQAFVGNVRELRQVLLRAYAGAGGAHIGASDIAAAAHDAQPHAPALVPPEAPTLEAVIRTHIRRALAFADGNLSEAARLLAVPRTTLQHYLVKYGVGAAEPRGRVQSRTRSA